MNLKYILAKKEDADILIEIYNASFYDDYTKYGNCPAYGRTTKSMEESIIKFQKHIIYCDDNPVGVIAVKNCTEGEYYLGCLCVIPRYQGNGIGTQAIKHMLEKYTDLRKVTLVTPADKEENINFYTKKCKFVMGETSIDGNVKLVHLSLIR